jgi:hypothetical protein
VDREPVGFAEGKRFLRFHFRSKHGQGNHGRTEEREDRERSERSDHLGFLTVAGRRSRCARGSIDNSVEQAEFRRYQLFFGCWRSHAIARPNITQKRHGLSAGGQAEAAIHRMLWGGPSHPVTHRQVLPATLGPSRPCQFDIMSALSISARTADGWRANVKSTKSSAQQSTDLVGSVIDFDLKHRISEFQFSTRCFGGVDIVKFRFEMTIDDRHEPFGRRSVGS